MQNLFRSRLLYILDWKYNSVSLLPITGDVCGRDVWKVHQQYIQVKVLLVILILARMVNNPQDEVDGIINVSWAWGE